MIHALKFPFFFDPERLKADVAQFPADAWVPHFNKPYYEGEWSGIALRSVGGMDGRLYPDPTAQTAYADTPTLEHCSYVQEVLATFACPLEAVRFLKLRAGSHIREHRDYNLGYEDGEIRVHVPVVTNDAVAFYLNRERIMMNEGECWYVNTNLPHHVVNNSATDRIHLVIDCVVNDWVHNLFAAHAQAAA
jgi:hypothetical protein